MTTRREVLSAAGLTAMAGLLGACKPEHEAAKAGDRLLVRHEGGLGIFDGGTGKWLAPPTTGTVHGARLASVEGSRLLIRDAGTATVSSECALQGTWTPRATDGDQVVLVAGAHAAGDIYRPEPRTQTSLLVMRDGKERKRFDLPGNLEPEAFSNEGDRLFILDYLPPKAPNVYRVRVLDLFSGELQPLLTKQKVLVPEGAEEVMRGQGRHAVHDPTRAILFTLYTHQGDHQHTGELLGVRPGAPNVHSFIHALHLFEGWAVCIDLPAPFGTSGSQGHTIALSANGSTLYAVSAEHGAVAVIDPDELAVKHTRAFTPSKGEAAALGMPDGRLLIGAGRQLTMLEDANRDEWQLDSDLRGLALGRQLWAGRDGGVTALQWDGRKQLQRNEIPGLVELRQAFALR